MRRDEKLSAWIVLYSAILARENMGGPVMAAHAADDAFAQLLVREDACLFEDDDMDSRLEAPAMSE